MNSYDDAIEAELDEYDRRARKLEELSDLKPAAPDYLQSMQHARCDMSNGAAAILSTTGQLRRLYARLHAREAAWREVLREMARQTIAEALKR